MSNTEICLCIHLGSNRNNINNLGWRWKVSQLTTTMATLKLWTVHLSLLHHSRWIPLAAMGDGNKRCTVDVHRRHRIINNNTTSNCCRRRLMLSAMIPAATEAVPFRCCQRGAVTSFHHFSEMMSSAESLK